MRKEERGFTALTGILIVTVIVLLGVGGWFVMSKNKKDDTQKTGSSQPKQENKTSNNQQPIQKYLTIKEWGVRIKTSANDDGAYYHFEPGRPNFAYLSTESLKVDDCGADKTTLGVYGRFKEGDRDALSGELMTDVYRDAMKVGNYYYYYQHPQASCSDNEATIQKAGDAMTAFGNDLDTLEAIPAQ